MSQAAGELWAACDSPGPTSRYLTDAAMGDLFARRGGGGAGREKGGGGGVGKNREGVERRGREMGLWRWGTIGKGGGGGNGKKGSGGK